MILCGNPKAQYEAYKDEIDLAISTILLRGTYINGKEVENFEKVISNYIGCRFGIGVGIGNQALHLSLVDCGVLPGDEVITVSHTAVATVAAIELAQARPVFVDIDPRYFIIN